MKMKMKMQKIKKIELSYTNIFTRRAVSNWEFAMRVTMRGRGSIGTHKHTSRNTCACHRNINTHTNTHVCVQPR